MGYVSVVIPCYRSARVLPALVARLEAVLPTVCERYEIVLVVDGSPDGTWDTASRVGAVTVRMDRRDQGRSGYTLRTLTRYAVNVIAGYSTAPLRLVTYLGFLVGAGGLALFVRVLWLYFAGVTTVPGFTTIAGMLAVLAAVQMLGLGVVGAYVGRLYASGMGRPTYVIRDRVEAGAEAVTRG